MNNGHAKTRPDNVLLKAAGYWIRSAPAMGGSHTIYWWQHADDSGPGEHFSKAGAEREALKHLQGERV